MTSPTARFALNKIVLGSDNVDVLNDFNTNWDAIDLKLGSQVCTFATLPASPPQGMTAYATDNNSFWVNDGTSGSPSWVNINPNSDWYNVVTRYGADPTGTVEAAGPSGPIQLAINAAAANGGGIVYIPPGTYKCTPTGSPATALTISNNNVLLVGAGASVSVLKKNGNGILVSFTGTTSPSTGSTHVNYCGVENLGFNGNSQTGSIWQLYYVSNFHAINTQINSNSDLAIDCVEFWDSRFYNTVIVSCTGTASSTTQPNIWIRNSSAASGVGASTGSSNNITFTACRFEAFGTGALWVTQGVSNSANPNNIKVIGCKFEGDAIQGGPAFQTDSTTKAVVVDDCHFQIGGFAGGFSTAQIVVSLFGGNHVMSNCTIGNSGTATITDGVLLHAVGGTYIVVENVMGVYTTAPTTGHLVYDASATGTYAVTNSPSVLGVQSSGNAPTRLYASPVNATTTINTGGAQTLQTATVPANEPSAGSVYTMEGYGQLTGASGTSAFGFTVQWAGTTLAAVTGISLVGPLTSSTFEYRVILNFQTATSVVSLIRLSWANNAGTGATNNYAVSKTATTVVSNASSAFIVQFNWSTFISGDTISLLGGKMLKEI